ncbi:transposase [Marinilactibacillus psychrotolerans]|uniref:transposase n=1 Tax=Marinilactibacillus psychrotolerans TaxID=191770 RepID=UPI001D879C5B|nr:hypothetical protein B795N_15710 [Marinilactibacillus psychrotolerans]
MRLQGLYSVFSPIVFESYQRYEKALAYILEFYDTSVSIHIFSQIVGELYLQNISSISESHSV